MSTLIERLFARCEETASGCWEWRGAIRNGYGAIGDGGMTLYTHRVAYEYLVGPIPDGLVIDHLCRNRPCCNPEHLEPVTPRENVMRGERGPGIRVTKCHRGHDYTPANTYVNPNGHRVCRTCIRWRRQTKKRAA